MSGPGQGWYTAQPARPGAWPAASFPNLGDAIQHAHAHQQSGAIIGDACSPETHRHLKEGP